MAPTAQLYVCDSDDKCFFGDFPTLYGLSRQYQKATPVAWLVPQLLDVSEFCGCKGKLDEYQLRQCAMLIFREYGYMKVSELMLFFVRMKTGWYGEFYGAVDPVRIMSGLRKFATDRGNAIFRHEGELAQQEIERGRQGAVTWEEYCKERGIVGRPNPLGRLAGYKEDKGFNFNGTTNQQRYEQTAVG